MLAVVRSLLLYKERKKKKNKKTKGLSLLKGWVLEAELTNGCENICIDVIVAPIIIVEASNS